MGNSSHFAKMPGVSIPRTMMKLKSKHSASFKHGELIPLGGGCIHVLPGDTLSLDFSTLIRMSTPVLPIMDDIECQVTAFFCPLRLLNVKTEEIFIGKDPKAFGTPTYSTKFGTYSLFSHGVPKGSVAHHFGKPYVAANASKTQYGLVNNFKERAYWLICNEWFRPEQIENPILVNTSNANGDVYIAKQGSANLYSDAMPYIVAKDHDYFTSCTMAPQYGQSVTLPLGVSAPVNLSAVVPGITINANSTFNISNVTQINPSNPEAGAVGTTGTGATANLTADLSNATAASINSIRYAFQLQKYLERSNFGNDRFFEVLKVHYGVTSPDARLQRPEYLGGSKFFININQVTATADTTDSAGNIQPAGSTGAVSVTGHKCHLFTKSFVEPGVVVILMNTRQKNQTYSQGILREDMKSDRWDFYTPEFCNLGDQSISKKELYLSGNNLDDNVFGYQEHWAEYRYLKNTVAGDLDPAAPNSIKQWNLANNFATQPGLDANFIKESRDNLARCLVTGANGPDFIFDALFDYTAVREMPAYTIPGLVDHFGVR